MYKNIITILIVSFIASFAALNYSFMFSEAGFWFASFSPKQAESVQSQSIIHTYLFPLSADIAPTANTVQSKHSEPEITSTFGLQIPALGVSVPIIFEPTVATAKIYKDLEKGVVHYVTTVLPGDYGTSIILGHSSRPPWYAGKYGTVFSSLDHLNLGDAIIIYKDGVQINYKVSNKLIFYPKTADDFELKEFESTDSKSLILMTCWPTGTNYKRIAIKADIVQ